MRNIYDLTIEQLEDYFLSLGEKKFKAIQLYTWFYQKKIKSFDMITDIKKSIITHLESDFSISNIELVKVERDTEVNKYLFRLQDNSLIESVLMRHDYGTSICISSEVGCNMGCKFCESGRLKKVRGLETGEMVEQILAVEDDIKDKITHVVVMGIGEPFDNYDNVMKFIKIVNDSKGIDIGARHITISTCGIVPKIKEFTKENTQVNLAISLHAPNNALRDKIMPINKVYNLDMLIPAIKEYISVTNRRVTFEYIMLKDVNDTPECALELAKLIKGMNVYVNLIPYNETENISFKRSENVKIMEFYDILKKSNINVTIRKEFGGLLSAACGQLRSHG